MYSAVQIDSDAFNDAMSTVKYWIVCDGNDLRTFFAAQSMIVREKH